MWEEDKLEQVCILCWGSLTDNSRHLKATQKHPITKINLHFVGILTSTFSQQQEGLFLVLGLKGLSRLCWLGAKPSSAPSPGPCRRSLYSDPPADFPQDRFITFGTELWKEHYVKAKQFMSPYPLLHTPVCGQQYQHCSSPHLGFPRRISWTCWAGAQQYFPLFMGTWGLLDTAQGFRTPSAGTAAFWGIQHPSLGDCTADPDICKT